MIQFILPLILLGAADSGTAPAAAPSAAPASSTASGASMSTRVHYSFRIEKVPAGAKSLRLWVPIPQANDYQTLGGLSLSPDGAKMTTDPLYGNKLAYFEWEHPKEAGMFGTLSFDLTRTEEKATKVGAASEALAKRLLEPDRLGPINDRIKEMSAKAVGDKKTTMEKARGIYDYVLNSMTYNKDGTGWGRGDVVWACDSKRGNCSDFHATFISMARAAGIPARFHYGFSLKPDGTTAAHCWAEFLDEKAGWVPVDISEANKVVEKEPAKRDYYFGTLSENRVAFTMGRDIVLEPKQDGEPLNFMYSAYAEVDGKPIDVKLEVKHELKK